MNTYTKRDHVFAKLNLQLQRGTVTLLHKEQGTPQMNESAFMQLEFSGTLPLRNYLPLLSLCGPMSRRFSLFAVVNSVVNSLESQCKNCITQCGTIALRGTTGLGSCEPLVITFIN